MGVNIRIFLSISAIYLCYSSKKLMYIRKSSMIARSTIDKIFDTARVEEVVGDFVKLKRSGSGLTGLCPFHNEKTPSFHVSVVKGIYKCFGCGQAGNAVNFVMEHEKMTYPEALRYLAQKYNIDIEEDDVPDAVKEEQQSRESLLLLNKWAQEFYTSQMLETENGRSIAYSYFKNRGFTDETIAKFQLGFHPNEWTILSDTAQQAGYAKEYLVKTGLSIEKDDRLFDRFRNRVTFPIHNLAGKVIAFGARILDKDKKQAKYLNSPESEVYHKSNVLYGIHLARKSISAEDTCYLVEGYTDVISLHQAGIENVVSSSGTSLTIEQIRLINRYTKNITILYDGDSAGVKASFRGIDLILSEGMNVKIALFPEGDDPDSFARNNSPLYIKDWISENAKDFIAFKTLILQEETKGDPIKKAGMIHEIMASVALIPDSILRSLYIKQCSETLDMDEQALVSELNKRLVDKQQRNQAPSRDFPEAPPEFIPDDDAYISSNENIPSRFVNQEADVIRILISFANEEISFKEKNDENKVISETLIRVGDFILSELLRDDLLPEEPTHKQIFNLFFDSGENPFPDEKIFLQHPDSNISSKAIHLMSNQYHLSEEWQQKHNIVVRGEKENLEKSVIQAVYAFKLRKVQAMLDSIDEALKQPVTDDELVQLLSNSIALHQAKMAFSNQLTYVIL